MYFYEAKRILFVHKENKNNDFIQQFVSFASPWRHFGEYHDACACFDLNVNKVVPGWHGGDELLNKIIIFVFFVHSFLVAS